MTSTLSDLHETAPRTFDKQLIEAVAAALTDVQVVSRPGAVIGGDPSLPLFLRRGQQPVSQESVLAETVEQLRSQLVAIQERLEKAERLIASRPPPEPEAVSSAPPVSGADEQAHADSIAQLTAYLERIEQQAAQAAAVAAAATESVERLREEAARTAVAQPAPESLPELSLADLRHAGLTTVRQAAEVRRSANIGTTADQHEVWRRLAEAAMNARAGSPHWIGLIEQVASAQGKEWGEYARSVVGIYDNAGAVCLETARLEMLAAQDLEHAPADQIDEIVRRYVAEIERVRL